MPIFFNSPNQCHSFTLFRSSYFFEISETINSIKVVVFDSWWSRDSGELGDNKWPLNLRRVDSNTYEFPFED